MEKLSDLVFYLVYKGNSLWSNSARSILFALKMSAMEQKFKLRKAWSFYDILWQLGLFQVAEQSYLKSLKGDIDFHLAEDMLSSLRMWLLYFVKSVIYHTIL